MPAPSDESLTIYVSGRGVSVPMAQFDRKRGGVKICRWFDCENYPKSPYRHYCSEDCHNKFWKWYLSVFSWLDICRQVWRRDKGHCRLCSKDLRDPKMATRTGCTIDTMPYDQLGNFEFDHIIPVSIAIDRLGYKSDYKFVKEILYNPKNLRLLCYECHKKVTAAFTSKLFKKPNPDEINKAHDKAMAIFRIWFAPEVKVPIEQTLLPYLSEDAQTV